MSTTALEEQKAAQVASEPITSQSNQKMECGYRQWHKRDCYCAKHFQVPEWAKQKQCKHKLKKLHEDAVLCLYSPGGAEGTEIISGGADEAIRVWKLKKKKLHQVIEVPHPYSTKEAQSLLQGEVKNVSGGHPINTNKQIALMNNCKQVNLREECENVKTCSIVSADGEKGPTCETCKKRVKFGPKVVCFCFNGNDMITGYSDGLIVKWKEDGEETPEMEPFLGHTNRINHLMIVPQTQVLLSASNDCTIRQWGLQTAQVERMYKFSDPMYSITYYQPKNLLFTSCWDKQIRALNFDTGAVESSFVGAREPVLTMHINDNKLYLAGQDPVIRCYDLETGKDQIFEGHKSWVLCLATYQTRTEDTGAIVDNWLLSGSDDHTIRIWDIKSGKMISELQSHHGGVTSLCFANGELFSGSKDHYIICWDVGTMRETIRETQSMLAEELMSRQYKVLYDLTFKKKKKGGKGAKGKKGKK